MKQVSSTNDFQFSAMTFIIDNKNVFNFYQIGN